MIVQRLSLPLVTAFIISLLLTAIVAVTLWLVIIIPQQNTEYNKLIDTKGQQYQTSITTYIEKLQRRLAVLTETVSQNILLDDAAALDLSTDESFSSQKNINNRLALWLKGNQTTVKTMVPEINSVAFFTSDNKYNKVPAFFHQKKTMSVSFLHVDMMNRLIANKPAFLEVFRESATSQWVMHKMLPLMNNGNRIGFFYTVLDTKNLANILSVNDPSIEKLSLTQFHEGFKKTTFLESGSFSISLPQKTYAISNSYWSINYSLSPQKNKNIPAWYFISVIAIFSFLITCFMLVQQLFFSRSKTLNEKVDFEKPVIKNIKKEKVIETDTPVEEKNNEIKKSDKEKNNSDVVIPENIFRAYDIRGIAYEEFSLEIAYAIGCAVATEVLAAGDIAMIIGRDSRTHSAELADCVSLGIMNTGCDVIDIGVAPTPLVNFAANQHPSTSSGIMITASHNPKNYNGCKIIIKGNTLVDSGIQKIKQRIIDNDVVAVKEKGKKTSDDFSQAYINHISSDIVIMPNTRVVVDAANGASSELAPRLLTSLGCKTTPLYCHFDGEFPHHDPDPSIRENLVDLQESVKENKADIGIALDGDGDRLVIITGSGRIVWPDQIMMFFSKDIVARHPGCDVVFDIKSSRLLSKIIVDNGGRPIICKTGHSHIKSKMRETDALLGGEFSGHIFFKERWFGFDDGLYAAARLLELMTLTGQTIDEMLDTLPVMVSTPEIKIVVSESNKFSIIDELVNNFDVTNKAIVEHTTLDGFHIDFVDGWGLIRASNTMPALTLRFEADNESALDRIKQYFQTELYKIDKTLTIH